MLCTDVREMNRVLVGVSGELGLISPLPSENDVRQEADDELKYKSLARH